MKVVITNTYKTHREQFQIVDATDEIAKSMIDRFFSQFDSPQPTPQKKEVTANPQVIIEPAKVTQAVKQAVTAPAIQEKVKKYARVMKVVNDTELYVVAINCGVCGGKEHTRLASTRNDFVKCAHCEQKLIMDQTMPELLLLDKQGYAFRATDPYLNDYEVYKTEYEMTKGRSND